MNYCQAMEYISGFSRLGKKVSDLSRIALLLNQLDNPQDKLNFVHISGTNGKGSVLELCSGALIRAGYKTGQFTSPFIKHYEDRIRINGVEISHEKVAEICTRVKNAVSGNNYSQFEITFAIALLYYLEEKCDIVFLETGLGGLLDATNIIKNPLVTVITTVSFDHEEILGNTIQRIAHQKAGIIKQNVPNILSMGNYKECVDKVSEIAEVMNAELIIPDETKLKVISQDIYGSRFIYKENEYFIKMNGIHQVYNACTVIETINQLSTKGFAVSMENVCQSLAEVSISGRIEVISEEPLVILDGAHNGNGIEALISVIRNIQTPVIGVFGILVRKDYELIVDMLDEWSSNISEIICVDGFQDDCISADKLSELFAWIKTYSFDYKTGYEFALKKAKEENKAIAVFGSLYLLSKMKKYLDE